MDLRNQRRSTNVRSAHRVDAPPAYQLHFGRPDDFGPMPPPYTTLEDFVVGFANNPPTQEWDEIIRRTRRRPGFPGPWLRDALNQRMNRNDY